jgi:mycothiol synthase
VKPNPGATSPLTSRLYQTEQDLQSMLDMLMRARSQTNDWHYAHVGELLFNFFMVACHLDPLEHIRLWHDDGGKLVAYAILGEDPSIDCQVLPEYEWTGIEEQAFTWAQALLARLRQSDPTRWGGELGAGSRQDDPRRINFLEQLGFNYSGRFAEVNMLRSLKEPVPELAIPPGYQVCSMEQLSDISDRAASERDVWLPWTVGNITDADYSYFMQLPGYHPDLDVVTLTPEGIIAAYVVGWVDPLNRIGDFGPVGARPAYRRQGLTRLALLESLRRMRIYGMDRVCVSTGVSNIPARSLYESIGFQIVNQYLDYLKSN